MPGWSGSDEASSMLLTAAFSCVTCGEDSGQFIQKDADPSHEGRTL